MCWCEKEVLVLVVKRAGHSTHLGIGEVALGGAVLGALGVNAAVLHVDLGAASLFEKTGGVVIN